MILFVFRLVADSVRRNRTESAFNSISFQIHVRCLRGRLVYFNSTTRAFMW